MNFTIDLDLPPKDRFNEVTNAMTPQIIDLAESYLAILPGPIKAIFNRPITQLLWYYNQNEKFEEIKGIVEAVNNTDFTIGKLLTINSLYELESWCTSVIVRLGNGTIIHGRNLDFDNADAMRGITYNARFVHGSKYSFDAVMFGGVVGTYTGVKKGAFSVTENQREMITNEMSLFENFVMLLSGYSEISWKVR